MGWFRGGGKNKWTNKNTKTKQKKKQNGRLENKPEACSPEMKQGPCRLCTDSQLVRLSQSLFSFLNYRLIKVPTPSFSFPFTSLFHLRNAILSALSWRMGLGERAVKKPLGGMQGRSVTSHQPKGRHKQHLRQWRRRHFFLILGMGQGFLAVPWRMSSIRSEGVFEGKKRHKRRHHYGWCWAHRGT